MLKIVALVCLFIGLIVTVVSIIKTSMGIRKKVFHLLLNILLFVSVLILINPFSFKLSKISDPTPLVIIDNSKSMADYDVSGTIDSIKKIYADKNITYMKFSDSLYLSASDKDIILTGNSTIFPNQKLLPVIKKYSPVIFITDGNFSNSISGLNQLKESECYYIKLNKIRTSEFSTFTLPDTLTVNGKVNIKFNLIGHSSGKNRIVYCINSNEKRLVADTSYLTSGNFDKEITVPATKIPDGNSVLTCFVFSENGMLKTGKYSVVKKMDKVLTVSVKNMSPSLDKHFLRIWFKKNKRFKITKHNPDIYISDDYREITRIKKHTLPIIVASLPLQKKIKLSQQNIKIKNNNTNEILNIPQPEEIIYSNSLKKIDTITSVRTDSTSYPILFVATYKSVKSVFISFKNIWKADFIPSGENKKSFAEILFNTIIEVYRSNLNHFTVVPDVKPDSINFIFNFPKTSKSELSDKFRFMLLNDKGDTTIDTVILASGIIASNSTLGIGSPKNGYYYYRAIFNKNIAFGSYLQIRNNHEDMSQQQNRILLSEFANEIVPTSFELKKIKNGNFQRNANSNVVYKLVANKYIYLLIVMLLILSWVATTFLLS